MTFPWTVRSTFGRTLPSWLAGSWPPKAEESGGSGSLPLAGPSRSGHSRAVSRAKGYMPKSPVCLWLGFLLLVVAGTGCVRSRPGLVIRYTLDPLPAVTAAPTAGTVADGTVAVRGLATVAPFQRYWVFRKDRFTLVQLAGHEWAEAPGEMVGHALVRELAATGRFRDVARAADRSQADWVISGEIGDFSLDRTPSPWRAVCEVRFDLRSANGTGGGWSRTLIAHAPLSANRLEAFPEAMSQAVTELLRQAVAALTEQSGKQAVVRADNEGKVP